LNGVCGYLATSVLGDDSFIWCTETNKQNKQSSKQPPNQGTEINPFTAPACKSSGLEDARTRLQTVCRDPAGVHTNTCLRMRVQYGIAIVCVCRGAVACLVVGGGSCDTVILADVEFSDVIVLCPHQHPAALRVSSRTSGFSWRVTNAIRRGNKTNNSKKVLTSCSSYNYHDALVGPSSSWRCFCVSANDLSLFGGYFL